MERESVVYVYRYKFEQKKQTIEYAQKRNLTLIVVFSNNERARGCKLYIKFVWVIRGVGIRCAYVRDSRLCIGRLWLH